MSDHNHVCQFCEGSYPGTTQTFVVDDAGTLDCDCKVTEECPGCSEHGACEDCGQAPAGDERNPFLCSPCADQWEQNREPAAPDADRVGLVELQGRAR
jgi:hypothetical protein